MQDLEIGVQHKPQVWLEIRCLGFAKHDATIERTHFFGKLSSHTFRGVTLNPGSGLIKGPFSRNREDTNLKSHFRFVKIKYLWHTAKT